MRLLPSTSMRSNDENSERLPSNSSWALTYSSPACAQARRSGAEVADESVRVMVASSVHVIM